jgi:hypothetical protein
VHLQAVNRHFGWSADAKADAVTMDLHHRDVDGTIDNDRFSEASGKNEHDFSS